MIGKVLIALAAVAGLTALTGDEPMKGLITTPTGEWAWHVDKADHGGWKFVAVGTSGEGTFTSHAANPALELTKDEALSLLAQVIQTHVNELKDSMRPPKRLESGTVMTDTYGAVSWELFADAGRPEGERVGWNAAWVTSGQGETDADSKGGFPAKADARASLALFLGVPASKVGGK